jgi:hypothetical protein
MMSAIEKWAVPVALGVSVVGISIILVLEIAL